MSEGEPTSAVTESRARDRAKNGPAPHLFIATPAYGGQVTVHYVRGLLKLSEVCKERGIGCTIWLGENESLITRARNSYVHEFLKRPECTHLLSIDADISFRAELAFALLDTGHDMVCAAYPKKGVDWEGVAAAARRHDKPLDRYGGQFAINILPEAGKQTDDGHVFDAANLCVPIRDAATGFLLTSRKAIVDMCYAHPETLTISDSNTTRGECMFALFDCEIEPGTRRYLSEDYTFSRRWQRMGGTVWCYLGEHCELGHVGSYVYRGSIYDLFEPQQAMAGDEYTSENSLPDGQAAGHIMVERYRWAAKHLVGARRIADACSGPGYGMPILREATGADVVGFDRSEDCAKQAAALGFGGVFVGDLEPLALDGFDAVCSLETIEHLKEPIEWLRNLAPSVTRLALSCPCIPTKHRNQFHLHDFGYLEVLRLLQAMGWTVKDHAEQNGDTIMVYAEREAMKAWPFWGRQAA